jgi:hypothetical protein
MEDKVILSPAKRSRDFYSLLLQNISINVGTFLIKPSLFNYRHNPNSGNNYLTNYRSVMKKLVIILIAMFISLGLMAQVEQEKSDPHWYSASFKVPTHKLDTLKKLTKEYSIPFYEELKTSGIIIDYHFLFHHTGDEYTLVTMTKHQSWDAINDFWEQQGKAFEEFEPDEVKRKNMIEAFMSIFIDVPHIDNIYIEIE